MNVLFLTNKEVHYKIVHNMHPTDKFDPRFVDVNISYEETTEVYFMNVSSYTSGLWKKIITMTIKPTIQLN